MTTEEPSAKARRASSMTFGTFMDPSTRHECRQDNLPIEKSTASHRHVDKTQQSTYDSAVENAVITFMLMQSNLKKRC